jgi:hypothetical protein
MALRSHEASSALATVDKFHDAMRVLSRRGGAAQGRDSGGAAHAPSDRVPQSDLEREARATDALVPAHRARRSRRAGRPALTPAARRLRALLVLVAVAVATLVGAVVGPWWLLLPHLVTDVLLLGFLCWLRSQAVAKEEREWRRAMGEAVPAPASTSVRVAAPPAAVAAAAPPVRVAGIPDRMPSRAQLHAAAQRLVVVPAARAEAVPQVRGAQGEPWQPVPVPVPTYVSAAAAPRRVLDLTRPGAASSPSSERPLGVDESGSELDHILDRRAVGD